MVVRVNHVEDVADKLAQGAVAIGNFDGVHRGHQALLQKARSWSDKRDRPCGVLTFSPHPAKVLAKGLAPQSLFTDDEKVAHLGRFGADVVVLQPFSLDFAKLSPTEFVERVLQSALKVGAVVVGEDFSFGHKGSGNVSTLRQLLEPAGVAVIAVPAVREGNLVCSSTKVREFVRTGNMPAAARILGRPYPLCGQVVQGDARGRELGFPTANVRTERELLPEVGVYATWAILEDGRRLPSVTNIGLRPTFDGAGVRIEAHILGDVDDDAVAFKEDLYGQDLTLDFVERIRPEVKFAGRDALMAQIQTDITDARRLLRQHAVSVDEESA